MLFRVRLKNSDVYHDVYNIMENEANNLCFLVYQHSTEHWYYILADNCVPYGGWLRDCKQG